MQKPFNILFDVGPFPMAGGRETPNNQANHLGPAPWAIVTGPSTRRVIDFGDPTKAVGVNPLGQSGVLFDRHYADQASRFVEGLYVPQHITAADVKAHTKSTLKLQPAP
jgi:penicillin amidase